jgi:hypothetical protein
MITIDKFEIAVNSFLLKTHYGQATLKKIIFPIPFHTYIQLEIEYLDMSESKHGYGRSEYKTTIIEANIQDIISSFEKKKYLTNYAIVVS